MDYYPAYDPSGGPTENGGRVWASQDDMDWLLLSASPPIPLSPFPANLRDDYHDSLLDISSSPSLAPPDAKLSTGADLMVVDELLCPQHQFPLQTNDLEVQPGGGWEDNESFLVEEQIQEVTPNFSSPTPAVFPCPDKATHATLEPKGAQGCARIAGSAIALPQDQGGMLIRAWTQGRTKERRPRVTKIQGCHSPLSQVVGANCYGMEQEDMELLKLIENVWKWHKHRLVVWRHFWWTKPCEYCSTVTAICKHCKNVLRHPHCKNVLRHPLTDVLSIHLKSHDNIDPLASTIVSKQTQRSSYSQALQIKEIVENPMPLTKNTACECETELIETGKSNRVIAMEVDTQCINTGAPSLPWSQHQVPIDLDDFVGGCTGEDNYPWLLDEQMASGVQWNPCCKRAQRSIPLKLSGYFSPDDQQSWVDLDIRLSESSCGIRLQTCRKNQEELFMYEEIFYEAYKLVEVTMHLSATWTQVSANPYKDPAGIVTATTSTRFDAPCWEQASARCLINKIFFTIKRIQRLCAKLTLGILVTRRSNTTLRPFPLRIEADSGRVIGDDINDAESGAVLGTNKRRLVARQWSPVWSHFTKVMVEDAQGRSVVGEGKCNHCGQVYRAHSKTDGTSRLRRHIKEKHPEHAESLKRKKNTA